MKDSRTVSNTPINEIEDLLKELEARKEWNRKRKAKQLEYIHCHHCGTPFLASRQWQKYCRPMCRMEAHEQALTKELEGLRVLVKHLQEENTKLANLLKEKA